MATVKHVATDGDSWFYCTECDEVLDGEVMCDCQKYAPVRTTESFTVTCDTCGYSGSLQSLRLHSCAIQEQGGKCEDFPCCGHVDGDGCQTLPEHTAEYWMELSARLGDRYEELDASGYWDQ